MIFGTTTNRPKWLNKSILGRQSSVFGSKRMTFGLAFDTDFSTSFQKIQKCEISEEYNAKRGSEPSKTFDFRIDFS